MVFDGLETLFAQNQFTAASAILKALNNRRFIFFITLKLDYHRLKEQEKREQEERGKNMRNFHGCEGRIEKSVPRITVWHHEAPRKMTNGDPEGRIIRIYHECEGRIEKSVRRITVWHHEAC